VAVVIGDVACGQRGEAAVIVVVDVACGRRGEAAVVVIVDVARRQLTPWRGGGRHRRRRGVRSSWRGGDRRRRRRQRHLYMLLSCMKHGQLPNRLIHAYGQAAHHPKFG